MAVRNLLRSRTNKVFFGLLGGLGAYFDMDPVFLRVVFIFVTILTALIPLTIAYFLSSLVVPLEPQSPPAAEPGPAGPKS
jgi:phage shock protein PspC (stress-responsive transcriptional regulator)